MKFPTRRILCNPFVIVVFCSGFFLTSSAFSQEEFPTSNQDPPSGPGAKILDCPDNLISGFVFTHDNVGIQSMALQCGDGSFTDFAGRSGPTIGTVQCPQGYLIAFRRNIIDANTHLTGFQIVCGEPGYDHISDLDSLTGDYENASSCHERGQTLDSIALSWGDYIQSMKFLNCDNPLKVYPNPYSTVWRMGTTSGKTFVGSCVGHKMIGFEYEMKKKSPLAIKPVFDDDSCDAPWIGEHTSKVDGKALCPEGTYINGARVHGGDNNFSGIEFSCIDSKGGSKTTPLVGTRSRDNGTELRCNGKDPTIGIEGLTNQGVIRRMKLQCERDSEQFPMLFGSPEVLTIEEVSIAQ